MILITISTPTIAMIIGMIEEADSSVITASTGVAVSGAAYVVSVEAGSVAGTLSAADS
jgi:hypothetical protein